MQRILGGPWRRAALLIVAVLLAANVTLVVGHHTGRWDASDFFCPYFILIADHVRHGELLLWTPLVECGCPAGFDPETGALSPLTVAFAAVLGPSEWAFRMYWLAIWGSAGLGVLAWARYHRAPPWAASAAAIGYMFSAVFTGQAEYTAYLAVMAALPWTLWRLDVAIDQRRLMPGLQSGAIWGLAALSGYPAMFIIGECYLAACVAWRLRTWKSLPAVAAMVAVHLVVLAPAYVGFLNELRGYSDRSGAVPRDEAVKADSLDPRALSTFASPYVGIVGGTRTTRLWTTDVAMSSVYLSPAVLVLGLAAPWLGKARARRKWLLALGLLCLALALGDVFPVRGWLYDLLPPMRYFRHAAMFRCYYVFTLVLLAVLAGRALQTAGDDATRQAWRPIAAVAIVAATVALGMLAIVCVAARLASGELTTALLAAAHAAIVWLGVAALAVWAARRGQSGPSTARLHTRLVALCIFDAVLTIALSKPCMYTNRRGIWPPLEAAHIGSIDLTAHGLGRVATWGVGSPSPLNACVVGKVPVLSCFNVLRNDLYRATVEHPVLSAAALGDERIWFAPAAARRPLGRATFARLAARSEALGRPCIVVCDPAEVRAGPAPRDAALVAVGTGSVDTVEQLPPAVRLAAEVRRYDDRRLEFQVRCPGDGWLLVTDRWAPGWKAWVNERPETVWIGNMVFRAVAVHQGENRVRFQYCPAAYPWLIIGSWSLLGLVLLLPVAARASPGLWRSQSLNEPGVRSLPYTRPTPQSCERSAVPCARR